MNYETVENWNLKGTNASVGDLMFAADWLGQYETDDEATAQSLANVIAVLTNLAATKQRKTAINDAKRKFAQENGVKFSQVKIAKKVVA